MISSLCLSMICSENRFPLLDPRIRGDDSPREGVFITYKKCPTNGRAFCLID